MSKKKVVDLIYEYVRKQLAIFNAKATGSGITRIPTDTQIKRKMEEVFETLRDGGLNPTSAEKIIKTPDDVGRVISRINENKIAEIKARQESAKGIQTVIDKLNKGIPLNPGDQARIEGTGMKTTLEAFQGFKPKVIEGDKKGIEQLLKEGIITRGTAPKTTKETIKRKSMIDPKLTEQENIKKIMAENKAAAKRLEKKLKKENPFQDVEVTGKIDPNFDPDPTGMASGGIAGQLHLNQGGRVRFDKGGMSRRNFMKLMAGLASIPVLGKFFKLAKTAGKFKGTPNLVVDITKTPNMPDWYIPLVKKVLNKGDDVTSKVATSERQIVHRDTLPDGDEVTVTQNIDNQTIDVSVANPKDNYLSASGSGDSSYTIQFAKGTEIGPHPDIPNALTTKKSVKNPDTLKVEEPYVVHRGEGDTEIDFDIVDYNPKKEVHNTSVLESYATGKKVKDRGTKEVPDPYEGYSPDLKAEDYADYAKGGLAGVLNL